MAANFMQRIIVNRERKKYQNAHFDLEVMAKFVLIKREQKTYGNKYVIKRYFDTLLHASNGIITEGRYELEGFIKGNLLEILDFCLDTIHFGMCKSLYWLTDICDLILNDKANIFGEIPARRIQ